MDIAVRHSITYSTSSDVPVRLVAESLLANERLLIESIRVIESVYPGFNVQSISVKVAELSNSSPLREALIVAIVATFQKDLVKEVPALIEQLTGSHIPSQFHELVTFGVLVIALYILGTGIERLMPGRSAKKIIEQYQQKLERMSEITGIPKDVIERYTEARANSDRNNLVRKSIEFFAPAKLDVGTEILLENGETVPADAISEIPSEMDFERMLEASGETYELHGVVVDIHRSDKDEGKHGWRAVIETVSPRKVRMELAPTIKPDALYGEDTVVGDVLIREGRIPNSDQIGPIAYHLMRVRNGEETE